MVRWYSGEHEGRTEARVVQTEVAAGRMRGTGSTGRELEIEVGATMQDLWGWRFIVWTPTGTLSSRINSLL